MSNFEFFRNLKMFDVRLNDNFKCTSGINLEGRSFIRSSQKVLDPPKNGPIAPMQSIIRNLVNPVAHSGYFSANCKHYLYLNKIDQKN